MIPELRIDGTANLKRVNAALKGANPALRRELSKAITVATKAPKQQAQANITSYLPSSGGLAGLVAADTKIVTQRTGGRAAPGIRIVPRSRRELRRMDRGQVRHPLFGNRGHWFTTRFRPGWFTHPMQQSAPAVRKEIMAALTTVARKIARST